MKIKVCNEEVRDLGHGRVSFIINNKELEQVEIYKYLGVFVDTNLNFQSHHKKMVANVQSKLSHFRKIRYFITKKAAILIYKCTILPILEYADFIYDQGIVSFVDKVAYAD